MLEYAGRASCRPGRRPMAWAAYLTTPPCWDSNAAPTGFPVIISWMHMGKLSKRQPRDPLPVSWTSGTHTWCVDSRPSKLGGPPDAD